MIEFEIKTNSGDIEHVMVLDMFIHKYTKETMRNVRIDGLKPFSTKAMTRFETLNEEEFEALMNRRVNR